MAKRILRGIIKVVTIAAALVFIFDNRTSGTAGIVLLSSIAVLALCFFIWQVFGLGDGDGFWPDKPKE